jgi:hypothetical protein
MIEGSAGRPAENLPLDFCIDRGRFDQCRRQPLHPAGHSRLHPVRQRTGVRRRGRAGMDLAVGTKTAYIERGSPWENGYIESSTPAFATSCSTAKSSTLCPRPKSSSRAGGLTTTGSGRTHRSDTRGQHRRYLSLPSPRGRLRYANRLRRPSWRNGHP